MKLFVCVAVLAAVALAALASGCGGGGKRLDAGGSTFIYPMMTKWADEYKKATGVEVNYQAIGSGGGIQKMTAKTFDFGCTDRPMTMDQLAECQAMGGEPLHIPLVPLSDWDTWFTGEAMSSEALHIPLVLRAVVPTYNLKGVGTLKFTGQVLADVYLGNIKKWNDPALKKLNPEAALPDEKIVVVHRSDRSAATYIWLDYLSQVSGIWMDKVGVGRTVNWPVGQGQKGNEGVAGQVRRTAGSIGYVGMEYALENNMRVGMVQNQEGVFVTPTVQAVTAAANGSLKTIPRDLRISITDAPGKDSYPICGAVWAVVHNQLPSPRGQMVVDFLRWITHEGQEFCEGLNYARLPQGLVERVEQKLDQIKVGS